MVLCFGKLKNQKMLASHCFLEENIRRYTRYRANYENNSNAKLFFGYLCDLVDLVLERKGEFHRKKCSMSFNMMSLPHAQKLSCACINMDVPCLYTLKKTIYEKNVCNTTQLGFCHRVLICQSSRQKNPQLKMTKSTESHKIYTLVLQIPFSGGL